MVKFDESMSEAFKKVKVFSIATSSKDGEPNVVPIGYVWLQDDEETLWVVDNFMVKTLANLKENPRMSLYAWDGENRYGFQAKCDVVLADSGAEFEAMQAKVHENKPDMPAKTLIKATVTDVFSIVPGADAGKRLL